MGLMTDYDEVNHLLHVYGIPIEWFHQVDRACDAYFKRKGIKWNDLSFRDKMRWQMLVERNKKKMNNK